MFEGGDVTTCLGSEETNVLVRTLGCLEDGGGLPTLRVFTHNTTPKKASFVSMGTWPMGDSDTQERDWNLLEFIFPKDWDFSQSWLVEVQLWGNIPKMIVKNLVRDPHTMSLLFLGSQREFRYVHPMSTDDIRWIQHLSSRNPLIYSRLIFCPKSSGSGWKSCGPVIEGGGMTKLVGFPSKISFLGFPSKCTTITHFLSQIKS